MSYILEALDRASKDKEKNPEHPISVPLHKVDDDGIKENKNNNKIVASGVVGVVIVLLVIVFVWKKGAINSSITELKEDRDTSVQTETSPQIEHSSDNSQLMVHSTTEVQTQTPTDKSLLALNTNSQEEFIGPKLHNQVQPLSTQVAADEVDIMKRVGSDSKVLAENLALNDKIGKDSNSSSKTVTTKAIKITKNSASNNVVQKINTTNIPITSGNTHRNPVAPVVTPLQTVQNVPLKKQSPRPVQNTVQPSVAAKQPQKPPKQSIMVAKLADPQAHGEAALAETNKITTKDETKPKLITPSKQHPASVKQTATPTVVEQLQIPSKPITVAKLTTPQTLSANTKPRLITPSKQQSVPEKPTTTRVANKFISPSDRSSKSKSKDPVKEEKIQYLSEKPVAYQVAFPKFNLDVHVYSKKTEQRFVLIEFEKYFEGDEIRPEMSIYEITRNGIIVDYRGELIRISTE